jgi:hypothetical protein
MSRKVVESDEERGFDRYESFFLPFIPLLPTFFLLLQLLALP